MKVHLTTVSGSRYKGKYLYRVGENVFVNLALSFESEDKARDFVHVVRTNVLKICEAIINARLKQ